MAKKLRVGVIGLGWPGQQHAKCYKRCEGVEVVALSDVDGEKVKRVGEELDVTGRYTSYPEMLDREALDAVSVATPNSLHGEMAIAAMKKGAHVLCEKPMASSAAMARKMVHVSASKKRILMVGYNRRFNPQSQFLKSRIDDGQLGEIYLARAWWVRRQGIPGMGGWFTHKKMSGGGALIDIGVHVLDLAMWFMGYPDVKKVSSCVGSRFGVKGEGAWGYAAVKNGPLAAFDVDDYAVAHIIFGKGRSLILQTSWASHIKREDVGIELWGDKGGARLDPLELFTAHAGTPLDTTPSFGNADSFFNEVQHFVGCIRTGAKPISPAEQGCKTVELIERIYRAAV